jgi:tetratricopeptide (TPR) repeat protein
MNSQGDYNQGVYYYTKGIETSNPKEVSIWFYYYRAQCNYFLHHFVKALEDLFMFYLFDLIKSCLEIDDLEPHVLFRIGHCFHSLGNFQEAIKYYDGSVKIMPNWSSHPSIVDCISKLNT